MGFISKTLTGKLQNRFLTVGNQAASNMSLLGRFVVMKGQEDLIRAHHMCAYYCCSNAENMQTLFMIYLLVDAQLLDIVVSNSFGLFFFSYFVSIQSYL